MSAGKGLKTGLRPIWLALGSGILLFLSFPGAVGLWPLAWIALVPLLLALKDVEPKAAARLGLITGMVHYVTLLYWVIIVLGRYGGLPLWISVPALLLLSLYMSVYLILFCIIINLAWKRWEILIVWLAPILWVGLDYIRSFLFSGFPWQDLGYSQYKALLLIQIADLTGHYGITFYIVLVNSVTALLLVLWLANRSADQADEQILTLRIRRAWLQAIMPALCMILVVLAYNILRYHQLSEIVEEKPKMKIGIAQGSIEQDLKWSPAMRLKTIDIYKDLSEKAMAQENNPPELFVWPETALPFLVSDNPYFRLLKMNFITKDKVWLLAGAPYYEKITGKKEGTKKEYRSYNSAYLFRPDGEIAGRYDKQHLVPFGEYVPFSDYLPLPGPLVENIGNFSSGKPVSPLSCQDAAIGVLICFESIFPEIARGWTSRGANLLVNITNDGWYGRSSAPWQHLSMAVFRAVENRRSLVRSANTGVSAFIDPLGRITGESPLFEPFYLVREVPLLQIQTIFVSFGHHFGLICLLGCLPFWFLLRGGRQQID
ncbi:MAG: apolipoprotein N-acyltransferase [Desulfobulbales bacterium]